jgi:NIMA (never in mitosis gene a)-related kinase 2
MQVDVWALGCVLYHMCAFEPPFVGENLISLGYQIVHKAPKNLPPIYSKAL